jgi:hypothetical protein
MLQVVPVLILGQAQKGGVRHIAPSVVAVERQHHL